ncbi:hypothetical protein DSM02_2780 [Leeuwenhoekiella polynyae]|uniref:Uncharacterized protein n=1 Tax=Leeuwenhoekiella polynyae TaxID=1550906 RepID=A0A4Q0P280_9FLAO|nr:hypothetical protein DSM02_2780 [Leeuwenhoekiella polynyae]
MIAFEKYKVEILMPCMVSGGANFFNIVINIVF